LLRRDDNVFVALASGRQSGDDDVGEETQYRTAAMIRAIGRLSIAAGTAALRIKK